MLKSEGTDRGVRLSVVINAQLRSLPTYLWVLFIAFGMGL